MCETKSCRLLGSLLRPNRGLTLAVDSQMAIQGRPLNESRGSRARTHRDTRGYMVLQLIAKFCYTCVLNLFEVALPKFCVRYYNHPYVPLIFSHNKTVTRLWIITRYHAVLTIIFKWITCTLHMTSCTGKS